MVEVVVCSGRGRGHGRGRGRGMSLKRALTVLSCRSLSLSLDLHIAYYIHILARCSYVLERMFQIKMAFTDDYHFR